MADEDTHDTRARDPRLDAAQTASGTAADTKKSAAKSRAGRKVLGVFAVLLIAFCSWALVVYLQGGNPLSLFGGSESTQLTAAGSIDEAGLPSASADGSAEGSTADDRAADAAAGDDTARDSSDATLQGDEGTEGKSSETSSSSSGQQSGTADGKGSSSSGTSSSAGSSSGTNGGTTTAAASGSGKSSSGGTATAPAQSDQVTVSISAGGSSARLTFRKGATVYDALLGLGVSVNATTSEYGIYVTSINGVAADATHGWTYTVNGTMPNVSAGNYTLSDGDAIVWTYVTVQ